MAGGPLDSPPALEAFIRQVLDRLGIRSTSAVPLVTSLPANPSDGLVVDFLADAAVGVVWRFRYRKASTSIYKWEFIGGAPIRGATSNNTAIVNNADAADGTAVTPPLAGDFDCRIYAHADGPATIDSQYFLGVGVGVQMDDNIAWRSQSGNFGWIPGASNARLTGLAAGVAITWRQWVTAGTWRVFGRRAYLIPIRVG